MTTYYRLHGLFLFSSEKTPEELYDALDTLGKQIKELTKAATGSPTMSTHIQLHAISQKQSERLDTELTLSAAMLRRQGVETRAFGATGAEALDVADRVISQFAKREGYTD